MQIFKYLYHLPHNMDGADKAFFGLTLLLILCLGIMFVFFISEIRKYDE